MQELSKLVGRAAGADATVLVTGESGTGKELVARAIHAHSRRAAFPLVAINCAAIPENLLEAELFGHERGAFTGADGSRPGKFELAQRGTLLLDEVGEMATPLQAKLLRVLQSREVTRLAAATPIRLDVRVIAMTNADLEARVADGRFREDLYYRLNVLRIHVPALRDRDGDVLLLARTFLDRERQRLGRPLAGFTAEAEHLLVVHTWPGNVRELENTIAQGALCAKGERISAEDIAPVVGSRRALQPTAASEDPEMALQHALAVFLHAFAGEAFERVERNVVAAALSATKGNQVRAAKLLGITRNVIRKRMTRYSML
jgi:two-component system response regulator HydG